MPESALNLTIQLVVRHDELENVNHKLILIDALVKVSGTQFPLDLAQKVGQ